MHQYYVYMMSSRWGVLYVGVTRNLARRVYEHRQGSVPGFTSKHRVTQLVYFETCSEPLVAIAREKEIKGWRRSKKVGLIRRANPGWKDLAAGWFEGADRRASRGTVELPASRRDSSLGSE